MSSYLDAFTIRVRKRAAKQANHLDNFDGSGGDLFKLMGRFLSGLDITTSHDKKFQGLLLAEGHSRDRKRRTLTATFLAGHYGRTSRFVDIYTSDRVFSRQRRHAEAFSFYFQAFLPNGQDEGILLIQRVGGTSPFTALKYFFATFFRSSYKGLVLEINSLVNREELNALLARGVAEKIRITDFHLRRRIEDVQEAQFHQELSASLVIRQRANEERARMRDLVMRLAETRRTGIAELDEHIDDYSRIKVSIEEGGQTRLIDLNSPKVRLSIEVNEPPESNLDAYQTYLEREAHAFMGVVASKVWGEQSNVWQR